jgi:hypothetical protein
VALRRATRATGLCLGLLVGMVAWPGGAAGDPGVPGAVVPPAELARAATLARTGKRAEAARLLEALVAAYPQDPRPYNELALLHYARGDVERARDLLQRAADTDPRYATVLRNLQTVYGVLASRAYERALGTGTTGVPALASLADDGVAPTLAAAPASSPRAGAPSVTGTSRDVAPGGAGTRAGSTLAAVSPVAEVPLDAVPPARGRGGQRRAEPPAPPPRPAVAKVERASPPSAPPARAKAGSSATTPSTAAVVAAVQGWANAWASQDAARYLDYYGHHFRPAGGRSRASWEALRRRRIEAPSSIAVDVGDLDVTFETPVRAVARFRQHYRSDRLDSTVTKVLRLSRGTEGWKIVRETVVR